MAVTKSVEIDGKEVTFRASAAIPRLYRNKFHRDIYKDLNELQKGIDENDPENSNLDTFSLELFENIAWLMAKHQNPDVPDTPEDWLDQFNTFSIYEILPQIIELWGLNVEQQVTSKKNIATLSGNDDPALFTPMRADRASNLGARFAHHRDCQRHVFRNGHGRLSVRRGRNAGTDGSILTGRRSSHG